MFGYNPQGTWTASHRMTMNGKRDDFTMDDFMACARNVSLKKGRAREIIREVSAPVSRWNEFAEEAKVEPGQRDAISSVLRVAD